MFSHTILCVNVLSVHPSVCQGIITQSLCTLLYNLEYHQSIKQTQNLMRSLVIHRQQTAGELYDSLSFNMAHPIMNVQGHHKVHCYLFGSMMSKHFLFPVNSIT